jgi:hypothetical protein
VATLTEAEEFNDTHGTLEGFTAREWRAVIKLALVVCEVQNCVGDHSHGPCEDHFGEATQFFFEQKRRG